MIFVDLTGTYHALVAAHLFIGDDLQSDNFQFVENFGNREIDRRGDLCYVGRDEQGVRVYTFGTGRNQELAAGVIEELRNIFGFQEKDLAVKSMCIPGSAFIAACSHIPSFMGGNYLQDRLGQNLIKWQFERIKNETLRFKSELKVRTS